MSQKLKSIDVVTRPDAGPTCLVRASHPNPRSESLSAQDGAPLDSSQTVHVLEFTYQERELALDKAPLPGVSRRQHERVRSAGRAEIFSWEGRCRAQIQDLSVGGAFIRCRGESPLGRYLTLRLRLPTGAAFTVLGRVLRRMVWSGGEGIRGTQASGVAMRFVDLSARDRRAIESFIFATAK